MCFLGFHFRIVRFFRSERQQGIHLLQPLWSSRLLTTCKPPQMLPPTIYAPQGCYYLHPQVQAVVEKAIPSLSVVKPVVLFSALKETAFDARNLVARLVHFIAVDDVFGIDFMSDTIVVQSHNPATPTVDLEALKDLETPLGQWDIQHVINVQVDVSQSRPLPDGPYFLHGGHLHQAWKLYPDHLDCFATTVVPESVDDPKSKFKPLLHLHSDGIWKNVAVPSRLYHTPSHEKPLAGKRISVKDSFRLAGVKTTLSSRAFEELYGPDEETAAFVTTLIDMGAVIVGKSKMSAFLSSEEPTDQWVDFHAPFNPRGDGYQTPAGSTNGGAAAIAGYSWLDYSIGTDTSGSIRYPAALCGLYALRYTTNAVTMQGSYAACRALDTVGLLGRDLGTFFDFVKATVPPSFKNVKKYPQKILYPTDFFPYTDRGMQRRLDDFVKTLEEFLGVKRTILSISDRWSKCPPSEAQGKGIREYLSRTGFYPFYWDGYHEYDGFRSDYRNKFDKEPYVGPYMRWKWETGSKVTLEQKNQSLAEMQVYRKWFADCILQQHDQTASDAILIMPLSCYAPDYRDTIHDEPGSISSFSEGYTASILSLPQLVLPVGQVPYRSRVSGRIEYNPVTASVVAAQGSELMLLNLAREAMKKAGMAERLPTGRHTFEVTAEASLEDDAKL